ncbi:HPr family phosphocarrier protein [Bacillus shivajii]|uniref:HPr family phosphocarrier protein n=1 Tax=Bacillus shivajii TaxID=1983719 RepID=UPI001CFB84C7|nr:HPr family phosphocarrier protein [Bacillus shivajii]UCZ54981.1 HPr family phosphocarrier protein [Bacillus shivajii]
MDFKKVTEVLKVSQAGMHGSVPTQKMVEVVQEANKYKSSIVMHTNNRTVDVKSFLGLTVSLLELKESELEIHGVDEEEAKKAMLDALSKLDIKVNLKTES